ncbi:MULTISPECIES: alpha/beta hydrolase [unclassified Clostridium]|uniref:alpha/beta fold hydrolase n=1 Tax=unclassified Clostridium TaxID=2614128 RepID=UPI0018982DCC|nr:MULTISPECIES: alpha/beta hydrolase [unclassified Clostridium]
MRDEIMSNKREYFNNFGMDEDVVEKVKKELSYIKQSGYFTGENNVKIYYEKYKPKKEIGKIVIAHGFTECIEKYREIIYYFIREGYSVYIMEHRGHGRSGKLGVKDKTQVNVENFNYYIEDFKKFLDNIVIKNNKRLYLFSHSMGGAIGAMFIEKYPEYFCKAILSCPMFQIAIGKVPCCLARAIAKISICLGKGDEFIFGNMPYESTYDFILASTSNESRYRVYYKEIVCNEKIQRGGGSFRWLYESLKAIKYIFKKKHIERIKIPVLIFQAGNDTLVGERGERRFSEKCDKCELVRFENAKHELYLENDDVLVPYLEKIFNFLES